MDCIRGGHAQKNNKTAGKQNMKNTHKHVSTTWDTTANSNTLAKTVRTCVRLRTKMRETEGLTTNQSLIGTVKFQANTVEKL